MTNSRRARVLVASHFPPPVTGMSAVNERIAHELEAAGNLSARVPMTAESRSLPGKLLGRVKLMLAAIGTLARMRGRGANVLYMPLDAHGGLIANILLAIAARALNYRVITHHHSFAYINRPSGLMRALLAALPRGTEHVFLCDSMYEAFHRRYDELWTTSRASHRIISNGFMRAPMKGQARKRSDSDLVLGHLSNLSRSKGTETFFRLFEILADEGEPVRAVVGGPAWEPEIHARLTELAEKYGDRFEWRGPLYGAAKEAFFESIDLFVFPTEYVNEAQPLVLVEALSHGVPILSIARGCIACDHGEQVGLVAQDTSAFLREAASFVQRAVADRDWLRALSERSQRAAATAYAKSTRQLTAFLESLGADACVTPRGRRQVRRS